ncbi:MAG: PAS domain-containing protein [Phycisphaerales bacterium JB050]
MNPTPNQRPAAVPASSQAAGLPRIDPRWDEPEVRKLIQNAYATTSYGTALATLVRSVSRVFGSEMCTITLVDRDTVRTIASHGVDHFCAERSDTICGECISTGKPTILNDLRLAPRFRDLPLVVEFGIGHYAGAPLVTSDGYSVGALCVMGPKPRIFTADEIEAVKDFAATAVQFLEQQRRLIDHEAQHHLANYALNSLMDGVYTLTPIRDETGKIVDFEYTMVNARVMELLDSPAKAIIGRRLTDVVPFVSENGRLDRYIRVLEENTPIRDEVFYDTTQFKGWFEISAAPAADGIVASFRNIDQRKHHESEIALAHERFKLLSVATDDIVWDYDMNGGLRWWSEDALARLGYPKEEIKPRYEWWKSLIHPGERQSISDSFERAIASGRSQWSGEYRLQRHDGEYIPVLDRACIIRDDHGTPIRALGAIIDLSAQVRAGEEIYFHRAMLEAQAEYSQDAILVTDAHHNRVRTNQKFRQLADNQAETLDPSQSLRSIYSGCLKSAEVEAVVSATLEDHSARISHEFEFNDGRAYEIRSEPINHGSGCFLGRVWFIRDLSRQRQANQLLRAHNLVLEASGIVLFRWSVESGWPVLLVSKNVEQFGYTADELLSRKVKYADMVHPDDIERLAMELSHHFKQRSESFEQEYRLICRDGSVRWVYDKTVVERDESGQTRYLQGVVLDITERRTVEIELAESESMLKELTSQIPGAVYQYRHRPDGTTEIPYISEGVFQVCGISPSEVYRDPDAIVSMVIPEDRERFEDSVAESARTLKPWCCEFRIRMHTGEIRWMSGNSMPRQESDGSIIWHGLLSDITARKSDHDTLVRTTTLFEQTNALAHVGGWEYHVETDELYVSNEVKHIFGISPDSQLRLEEVLSFYSPESHARIKAAMKRAIECDEPYDLELEVVTATGEQRWVRAQCETIRDADSNVILRGAFHNINDQYLAREELARRAEEFEILRDAAEAASRSKSEFIANMSHEIRTPLTAILGFSDLLRRESPTCEQDRVCNNAVDTIDAAGKHLLTIINDILDLSRIEAGRMEVEQDEVDLQKLIQDCIQIMRARADLKGLELELEIASPLPQRIMSDPTRLRQILLNLLGNAIKFTESGSVTVRPRIESDNTIVIDVEDTGLGIDPAKHNILFETFSQADASIRRRHGGTGLGLAISRRCAQLMGGTVNLVRSHPGEGSVFRITIPLTEVSGPTRSPQQRAIDIPDAGRPKSATIQLQGRILFAEDGPDNQRLIAFHLSKAGATVELADNGLIALDKFRKAKEAGTPYDLVLTDIQMPEMDGLEFTQTLRADGITTPIIAVTAHAMPEDQARCLEAGCSDYTTKPIDKQHLLETCATWLSNPDRNARQAA